MRLDEFAATRGADWTIEPHGKGFALFAGRSDHQHGLNLVYLSEPAFQWPEVKPLIEAAPDMLAALKAMLRHTGVADAAAEDKEPEDHEAERMARAAVLEAESTLTSIVQGEEE